MLSMTQAEICSECLAVTELSLNFDHLADPIRYLSKRSIQGKSEDVIASESVYPAVV